MNKNEYEFNSKIIIGNYTIFIEKKFNWFHRLMLKLVFGIIVENIR